MEALFEILTPGIWMAVQDMGRQGFQNYGVPVSGAMDGRSLQKCNILLGNHAGSPCIEICGAGGALAVKQDCTVALTGGDLSPEADHVPLPMYKAVPLEKGSILRFQRIRTGLRSYLSVEGGIQASSVMGSASVYPPVAGKLLRAGDMVCRGSGRVGIPGQVERDDYARDVFVIRAVPGPDTRGFTRQQGNRFFRREYRVSAMYDRMGIRLEGNPLTHKDHAGEILSHGVIPGSVQVPRDGNPIILMQDAQTSGGYSLIANVFSGDMHLLGQVKWKDRIMFRKHFVALPFL
ncbi:MAG: biotin-dependent carboxyltransferase family protein [Clostridia bacterium]